MVQAVVVRYEVRPECADENVRLVQAVYEELSKSMPGGFTYATMRLDDGATFVHVATTEGENPLATSAAFAAFQAGLGQRCVAPPEAKTGTIVGSYGYGGK